MNTTIVYPGTFDPLTNGHLDLIQRASRLFQRVVVAVAASSEKKPLFSLAERVMLAESTTAGLSNVYVISFTGLLVHCLAQQQAILILRAARSSSEFDRELMIATMNREQLPQVETLFLAPSVEWRFLSSSLVKEVARHGGIVTAWVPPVIAKELAVKLLKKR